MPDVPLTGLSVTADAAAVPRLPAQYEPGTSVRFALFAGFVSVTVTRLRVRPMGCSATVPMWAEPLYSSYVRSLASTVASCAAFTCVGVGDPDCTGNGDDDGAVVCAPALAAVTAA